MQRKMSFFLIAVILNCCISGMKEIVLDNGYGSTTVNNAIGCVVAEAADIEETNETTEDIVSDKTEENKKWIGEPDSKNTVTDNAEQIELTDDEIEQIEKSEDEQTEKNSFEEILEEDELEKTEESKKSNCIYNVSFPTNSKAYLDPDNLSGKGQIFSEEFRVENYGNTDVAIKIKSIEVYYRLREELYELSAGEVADDDSYIKKLNVDVVWKNKNTENILDVVEGVHDEEVLLLESAEFDENGSFVSLKDSSIGSFYFTGTLNSNPELVWEDGEITLSFDYEIVNMEEGETEKRPEEGLRKENMESEEIEKRNEENEEEPTKEENAKQEEKINKDEQEVEENTKLEGEIMQEDKEKAGDDSNLEDRNQQDILEDIEEAEVNDKRENLDVENIQSTVKRME